MRSIINKPLSFFDRPPTRWWFVLAALLGFTVGTVFLRDEPMYDVMALRRPLVIVNGQVQQIPTGDTLTLENQTLTGTLGVTGTSTLGAVNAAATTGTTFSSTSTTSLATNGTTDVSVGRDLSVVRDVSVTRNLTATGGTAAFAAVTATSMTTTGATALGGAAAQTSVAGGLGLQVNAFSGAAVTPKIRSFAGDPNGTVTGDAGSLCLDTSTPALWLNTTGSTAWVPLTSSTAVTGGWFGTGADGNLVFDGVSNVLGIAPVGGVYTLTRTVMAANISCSNTVTIDPAGFRLFASGTFTGPGAGSCIVAWRANNGANGAASTGGAGGLGKATAGFEVGGGGNGGAGGSGAAGGTAGGCHTNSSSADFIAPTGATGGNPSGAIGGGPGTNIVNSGNISIITQSLNGRDISGSTPYRGGCGGGGGGGNNGTSGGGGGGAGGNITLVVVRQFANAANVIIHADGGNGGTGNAGGGSAGGGGAGSGGIAILIYSSGTQPTVRANGGTGGAGAGGAGTAGGNGTNGFTIIHRTAN